MVNDGKEFNLLREPWIVVMKDNGALEEVGLIEVLERAHEFRALAGELPTQNIAIMRLLLAILHSVYGRFDSQGNFVPLYDDGSAEIMPEDAFGRWKSIWDERQFSHPILRQYLERYEDRFWLFHPERPFYQVPGMDKATDYTAAKLNGELAESSNKLRLFSSRSGVAKSSLSFAEAARWLLYVNGYDDTSAKPKGKNLPSPGAGWLGKLGLVVAVGHNLFETLMLNLTLLQDGIKLWEPGEAIWELDQVRDMERCEIPQPRNPAELLTLQSRRLLLHREGDRVVGYSLLGGDFFPPENAFVEQMTVWRKNTDKKTGPEEFKPRRHDPSRQIWRDFASLFVSREWHLPGVVSWMKQLRYRQLLDRPLFRFQVAAVKYGDKDFFIDDVFSDGIAFHADLMNETTLGEVWINRILDEIETTELLVRQVGLLAQNIARAKGESEGGRLRDIAGAAREQAYFRLDRPFRRWLEEIDPASNNPQEVSAKWWKIAQRIIREVGRELVENCGPRAYIERVVIDNKQELRYSVPQAYNQFLYKTTDINILKGGG
jgi:CRISPR system Cascade subunit CasA